MMILHVFTLHSDKNEFGGPIRVALNLAKEQLARGETAMLFGLERGFGSSIGTVENVHANLFPAKQIHESLGFSGLFNIKALFWAWRNLRIFDVVHIHLARDLVSLPVAAMCRIRKIPYVLQTHGMVDESSKLFAKVLDVLLTQFVLRGASRIFSLTPEETKSLYVVGGRGLAVTSIPNGISISEKSEQQARQGICFYARLQERKHPERFFEVAKRLIQSGEIDQATVAGPDEGQLSLLQPYLNEEPQIQYVGPLDHDAGLSLLSGSLVNLLPSRNEPFPMSILESLSMGTPVVITETCGLAPYIREHGGGVVSDGSIEDLMKSVISILNDWDRFSAEARSLAVNSFAIEAVVDQVMEIYIESIAAKAQ
jgi:glycosyltransferase involved in cell wall biosynthesis